MNTNVDINNLLHWDQVDWTATLVSNRVPDPDVDIKFMIPTSYQTMKAEKTT